MNFTIMPTNSPFESYALGSHSDHEEIADKAWFGSRSERDERLTPVYYYDWFRNSKIYKTVQDRDYFVALSKGNYIMDEYIYVFDGYMPSPSTICVVRAMKHEMRKFQLYELLMCLKSMGIHGLGDVVRGEIETLLG